MDREGVCVSVCRCVLARRIKPVASPRFSDARLSACRRVSLSFCLDWKREGPVFIKVGGSILPKYRQTDSSAVYGDVKALLTHHYRFLPFRFNDHRQQFELDLVFINPAFCGKRLNYPKTPSATHAFIQVVLLFDTFEQQWSSYTVRLNNVSVFARHLTCNK